MPSGINLHFLPLGENADSHQCFALVAGTVHWTVPFRSVRFPSLFPYQTEKPPFRVAFLFGGAEGRPVLTTVFSKEYIYSFRQPQNGCK